jgi:hypothetical protein
MADGIAEEADGSGHDRGDLESKRPAEGQAGRKIGHPDLELKRTRLLADVSGCDLREEGMGYGRRYSRNADREQEYPGENAGE